MAVFGRKPNAVAATFMSRWADVTATFMLRGDASCMTVGSQAEACGYSAVGRVESRLVAARSTGLVEPIYALGFFQSSERRGKMKGALCL